MTWIITGIAVIGVILNVQKKRVCFLFWIVSNAYLMVYDYIGQDYAESCLFAVYLILAIWGWVEWGSLTENRSWIGMCDYGMGFGVCIRGRMIFFRRIPFKVLVERRKMLGRFRKWKLWGLKLLQKKGVKDGNLEGRGHFPGR